MLKCSLQLAVSNVKVKQNKNAFQWQLLEKKFKSNF